MTSSDNNEQSSTENVPEVHSLKSRVIEFIKVLAIAVTLAFLIKAFFFDVYRIPTSSMENTLLVGDFIFVNKISYGVESPNYFPFTKISIPTFRLPQFQKFSRYDLTVFKFPGEVNEIHQHENVNYIKRIIGMPGDTLKIFSKKVFINGEEIYSPAGINYSSSKFFHENYADPKIFPSTKNWNPDYYGPVVIPQKGLSIKIDINNIDIYKDVINREFGREVVHIDYAKIYIDSVEIQNYTFKKDYYFLLGDNRDDSMDSRFWGFVEEDLLIGKAVLVYWSFDPYKSFTENFGFLSAIRFNRILKVVE